MKAIGLIVFLALISLACSYYDHNFPYEFEKGVQITHLEEQLDEVSGLFYKNETTLYAIQDEEGEIFEVDITTGKHNKIIDFKKTGDFEGIAKKGETFYALKSDGDIYVINKDESFEKYTFFDDDPDFEFEGLTFDRKKNALLIACKKHGDKDEREYIFIYSFPLDKKEYSKDPYLKMKRSLIHDKFKTSAISINPEGNLYLISAITNTIAEVNKSGKVINKAQLPYLIYNQVEGICFSDDGTLYISSEKSDQDKAKIIKIKRFEK